MADKVNLSLDELIQQSKQKGQQSNKIQQQGKFKRGVSSKAPRSAQKSRNSLRQPQRRQPSQKSSFTQQYQVRQNLNQGGVQKQVFRQQRRLPGRKTWPPGKQRAVEGDAVWTHDLYEETPAFNNFNFLQPALANGGSALGSTKLFISNLHHGVSEDDLKELFGAVGQLERHQIQFDKSGRSVGTAEVIFKKPDDALQAIKKYNNITLDSMPMVIQLVRDDSQVLRRGSSNTLSSGVKVGFAGKNNNSSRQPRQLNKELYLFQNNKNKIINGLQSQRQEPTGTQKRLGSKVAGVTKQQLDQEMDDFMQI